LVTVHRNRGTLLSGLLDVLDGKVPSKFDDSISLVEGDINTVLDYKDFVIITPNRSEVNAINTRVFPGPIAPGMKVIVTKNTFNAFNGMIGTAIALKGDHMEVDFSGRTETVSCKLIE